MLEQKGLVNLAVCVAEQQGVVKDQQEIKHVSNSNDAPGCLQKLGARQGKWLAQNSMLIHENTPCH
eukprot:1141656-Pelagomonas_calceolata.AAC.3